MAFSHSCIFGPSGETRTRGILHPNNLWNFLLTISAPFWHLLFQKSCSLELSSPLFPCNPKLSMVNNVVKSKHSPVHFGTGEHFAFCGVVIVAWKMRTVKSFLCPELSGYKQRKDWWNTLQVPADSIVCLPQTLSEFFVDKRFLRCYDYSSILKERSELHAV